MKKLFNTGLVTLLTSSPFLANAEGLERVNIDPSFMFTEGSTAEIGFGNVSPSLPAVKGTGSAFTFQSGLDVATSFSVLTGSVKTELGDNFDLGLFYTSQGNGVGIDYGTIGSEANVTIKADLEIPTLAMIGKYQINEAMSVFVGAKQSTVKKGATLKLGSDTSAISGNGNVLPDVTSHWELAKKSGIGAIYGAAYEMPEIALRVVLTIEDDIDLAIPATSKGGLASTGTATASIGDAMSLNFQTGIAEDTLLFGNIRRSSWADNQVKVPTPAGLAQVSSFSDGDSYSLGIGRKISDDLSVSISGFYDGSSGGAVSELAPTGATRTLSVGGKYAIADNADLSLGGSYSKRGDVLTGTYKASLTDSEVISLGAKLAFSF
jgi:long-subunit fatty acid transport protein